MEFEILLRLIPGFGVQGNVVLFLSVGREFTDFLSIFRQNQMSEHPTMLSQETS
jgi:hypothetical protein